MRILFTNQTLDLIARKYFWNTPQDSNPGDGLPGKHASLFPHSPMIFRVLQGAAVGVPQGPADPASTDPSWPPRSPVCKRKKHCNTVRPELAWYLQATSHYLSQCWPRSMSAYDITRSQWLNPMHGNLTLNLSVPLTSVWASVIPYSSAYGMESRLGKPSRLSPGRKSMGLVTSNRAPLPPTSWIWMKYGGTFFMTWYFLLKNHKRYSIACLWGSKKMPLFHTKVWYNIENKPLPMVAKIYVDEKQHFYNELGCTS